MSSENLLLIYFVVVILLGAICISINETAIRCYMCAICFFVPIVLFRAKEVMPKEEFQHFGFTLMKYSIITVILIGAYLVFCFHVWRSKIKKAIPLFKEMDIEEKYVEKICGYLFTDKNVFSIIRMDLSAKKTNIIHYYNIIK